MTEITARVRNRLQDGVINWQEKRFQRDSFRQQQADIHRSRMTCSASLPAFHQTQDWTGGLTDSGRHPVIEETKPRKRLISAEGIRWDAALAALILVAILLTVVLVADVAGIGSSSRMIGKLNSSIRDLENRNSQVQAEIELSASGASVRTEAVKMDLISSNGAKTIRITASVNAHLTLSTAAKAEENAELEGRMIAYAGD